MNEELNYPKRTDLNKIHDYLYSTINTLTFGIWDITAGKHYPSHYIERIEKWANEIKNAIINLSEKFSQFELKNLEKNDEFISILIHAHQLSVKNFQKEKLDYLKNMVINTPLFKYSFDYKIIFLRYIDELTLTHISILRILIEHENILSIPNTFEILLNQTVKLDSRYQDMDKHLFKNILVELEQKGLIRISPDYLDFDNEVYEESKMIFESSKNYKNLPNLKVMNLGREFIDFIVSMKTE